MENNSNQQAQKSLESMDSKNFFFEHVKTEIKKLKEETSLVNEFESINTRIPNPLSKKEFELLGMFSFLMGVDYTSQAYPQKHILQNVTERFNALNINQEEIGAYFAVIEKLVTIHNESEEKFEAIFAEAIDSMKSDYTRIISVKGDEVVNLKLIKSKINKFLDKIIVPIGYSKAIVEFKKSELTYENILKINDILNNDGNYTGSDIKKFTELYGDKLFMSLLNKAGEKFNQAKFAMIYEEGIITVCETAERFQLNVNPETYTDIEYEKFKTKYTEEQEKKLAEQQKVKEETDYEPTNYTKEAVMELMQNAPDEFVSLNLLENIKKNHFDTAEDVITAIYKQTTQKDFIEHIFTYLKQNQNNSNRCVGACGLGNLYVEEVIGMLNNTIKKEGETYKKLVEENCAEIPAEQLDRIVTYINDVIKECILKTKEQKQYLISQVLENGISTWNHLQQIMSIIETCEIYGNGALAYDNLYNYTRENSNIVEVFDKVNKINDTSVNISVFTAYKEWFSYHSQAKESEPQQIVD